MDREPQKKNKNAQELARLGASKGGKARAQKLSKEERAEIARQAAEARWGTSNRATSAVNRLLRAPYDGELNIHDLILKCAVLEDGTRVITEATVAKILGRGYGGKTKKLGQASSAEGPPLPVFLSGKTLVPFIPTSLRLALSKPIVYRGKGGKTRGFEASLLPEICDVWLQARDAKALQPSQEHIAKKAQILMRGLAYIGVIALIDDATGYAAIRDREELHRILEAYINKELLPWTKTFPDEYYRELFRLKGWLYSPPSVKRPQLVGKLTHGLIYKKLPRGVIGELKQQNPINARGQRRHKHFQFLTEDIGEPHLKEQLVAVTTLMRASRNWASFQRMFDRAFPGEGIQSELDLGLDEGDEV